MPSNSHLPVLRYFDAFKFDQGRVTVFTSLPGTIVNGILVPSTRMCPAQR